MIFNANGNKKKAVVAILISDKVTLFFFNLFSLFFKIFLYFFLAASGLSCGTRDLRCDARASLQLWHAGFLPLVVVGSRARGLCSLQHAGSLVEVHKLSSCGTRAQSPRSIWDLSSLTRDRTCVPCIGRRILHHWTTGEVPKVDFKTQSIIRNKEGYYIKIKGSIQEEDIAFINIHAPNIGAPKYKKHMLTEREKLTIIQ